jgi:hypothetical protein
VQARAGPDPAEAKQTSPQLLLIVNAACFHPAYRQLQASALRQPNEDAGLDSPEGQSRSHPLVFSEAGETCAEGQGAEPGGRGLRLKEPTTDIE